MRKETLMHYTKNQLVEKILCLENNNKVLEKTIEQQYKNAVNMLKEADIFNKTFLDSKKYIDKE